MKRQTNIFEVFYVMYSPLIMLLGNVISGLFYLQEVYCVTTYTSILTGYSLVFVPQFVINYKKYKLCKFYKAATICLTFSMVNNILYLIGMVNSGYVFIRLSLIVNIIGSTCYFFVKNCRKSKSID